MATRSFRNAVGLVALALTTVCLLVPANANDATPGFARLGPPDAPVKLFVEEKGEGAPVLLIHGFGASTYTWRKIAPALARDHRVIAVDLKGFGQSDKPFDEHYSVFDQAELLKQFIISNNLRNLTLVGHSFGGGVALVLALDEDPDFRSRIAKLALLDTIAYPQDIPVFFQMLEMPIFSHLGVRMVPPIVQTRIALRIAYLDNSKIDDEGVETYAAPLRTAAGKHAIIHSARQIVPEDLEKISARYKSIEVPTLIAWCDYDRIVPIQVGMKLRRTLPNSTLKIVEGCGHMPQEEQPEATLSLIQNFLAR